MAQSRPDEVFRPKPFPSPSSLAGSFCINIVTCGLLPNAGPFTVSAKLLRAGGKMADHHLFPRQFQRFFLHRGIDIDRYTITVDHLTTHLKAIHGNGNMGQMPRKWNRIWAEFIAKNPHATSKQVFQKLGEMMDDFGLSGSVIHPFGQ